MNEGDIVRLRHMMDEARKAQRFIQDRSRDDLDNDELLSYAVRYALQIIGEAASQVTIETRTQYPEIQSEKYYRDAPVAGTWIRTCSKRHYYGIH